jgi:hypothetical protein
MSSAIASVTAGSAVCFRTENWASMSLMASAYGMTRNSGNPFSVATSAKTRLRRSHAQIIIQRTAIIRP